MELARSTTTAERSEVIPREIIDRPASAELRSNQRTEEALLPFSELDPIIKKLVVNFQAHKFTARRTHLKNALRQRIQTLASGTGAESFQSRFFGVGRHPATESHTKRGRLVGTGSRCFYYFFCGAPPNQR